MTATSPTTTPGGAAMSARIAGEHSPFSSSSSSHRLRGWWSPQSHHCFITESFGSLRAWPPLLRPQFDVWVLLEEDRRDDWFDSGSVFMRHLKDFTHFLHKSGPGTRGQFSSCSLARTCFFQRSRQTRNPYSHFFLRVDSDLEVGSRPAL